MSRTGAFITVTCDKCGEDEHVELCALAGRGEWDERYVQKKLDLFYWTRVGDRDLCAECSDESTE